MRIEPHPRNGRNHGMAEHHFPFGHVFAYSPRNPKSDRICTKAASCLRMQRFHSLRKQDMHMCNSYSATLTPLPKISRLAHGAAAAVSCILNRSCAGAGSQLTTCPRSVPAVFCNPSFWLKAVPAIHRYSRARARTIRRQHTSFFL